MLLNFLQYSGQPLTTNNNLVQLVNMPRLRHPIAIYKCTKKHWISKRSSFPEALQLGSGQAVCSLHLSDPKACTSLVTKCCGQEQLPTRTHLSWERTNVIVSHSASKQPSVPADQKPGSSGNSCSGADLSHQGSGGLLRYEPCLFPPEIWDLTQVVTICAQAGAW